VVKNGKWPSFNEGDGCIYGRAWTSTGKKGKAKKR
jgi:hypothetical protein